MHAARRAAVNVMQRYVDNPEIIPHWMLRGRTVMQPKTERRDLVNEQRPITCLNTIYKGFSGVLANYKMEHVMENGLWDDQQFGCRRFRNGGSTLSGLMCNGRSEEQKEKLGSTMIL